MAPMENGGVRRRSSISTAAIGRKAKKVRYSMPASFEGKRQLETILRTPRKKLCLEEDREDSGNVSARRVSFSTKVQRAMILSPYKKSDGELEDVESSEIDQSITELSPVQLDTRSDIDHSNKPYRQLSKPSEKTNIEEKKCTNKRKCFGTSTDLVIQPNVKVVYGIVSRLTGKIGGNGHGGAIYGELSIGSMQKVINNLKKFTDFSSSSRFIDVGCGLGKPSIHVAQDPGVEFSYGIEMEEVRWILGQTNINHVVKKAVRNIGKDPEDQIGYKCILEHGNINQASTLDPFTHVYMFDVGFPPKQHEKLAKMFNRSNSQYLISYFSPRYVIHKYKYNVELLTKFQTNMHGSSEVHMCYMYERCRDETVVLGNDLFTEKCPCDPLFKEAYNLVQTKSAKEISSYIDNKLQMALSGPSTGLRRSMRRRKQVKM